MKSEHLLEAVGRIDDELVLEAARAPRRRAVWARWGALAAAAALCVGLIGAYRLFSAPKGSAAPASPEQVFNAADAEASGSVTVDASLRAASGASAPTASAEDVCKPVFFLNGTANAIAGFEQALPDGCAPLGQLKLFPRGTAGEEAAKAQDATPYVNDEALVGSPVWQDEDGDLFIQLDDDLYVHAEPMRRP